MDDRSYPSAPVIGIGAVIWKEDHFLLIQRGKEPMKGRWSLPGGKLELGESLQDGLSREITEETGLMVRIGPLIDVIDYIEKDDGGRVRTHYSLVDYIAFWQEGDAVAGSDAAALKWVTLKEIQDYDLWSETRRLIEKSQEMITKRVR